MYRGCLAGALSLAAVVLVACGGDSEETTTGPAPPESVPSGAVAIVGEVEDGVVSQEDFDAEFDRVVEQQGLKEPPGEGDPEFEAVRDQAMMGVLQPIWIEGEAAEQDITVSDEEIDASISRIVKQSFKDDAEFEKFVKEQGFCTKDELAGGDPADCDGVQRRAQLQLLTEELQKSVLGDPPEADPTKQQELVTDFVSEFVDQWRAVTLCAEPYVTDQCSNGPEPPPPPDPTAAPPTAAPPGAVPPGAAPPGAVPPGAAPPGAVPPGAVPPGAVPPGAVPPGAAPPGAVPQSP